MSFVWSLSFVRLGLSAERTLFFVFSRVVYELTLLVLLVLLVLVRTNLLQVLQELALYEYSYLLNPKVVPKVVEL